MDLTLDFINMKPRTKRQIDRLLIDREKPLFISDADEVVLYFAKHFKSFLESRGWALNLSGYRLDKAITHKTDGSHPDKSCLLYTSPSPRDRQKSRMPSSA